MYVVRYQEVLEKLRRVLEEEDIEDAPVEGELETTERPPQRRRIHIYVRG